MNSSSKPDAESPPPAEGIFGAIAGTFSSARQLVGDFVELITLEARRAGLSLMWIVALGTVAAIFIAAAWFCLMAAVVFWLVSLGMTWAGALAVIAVLNLLAAGAGLIVCILLSRNLLFPATRRQLKGHTSSVDIR